MTTPDLYLDRAGKWITPLICLAVSLAAAFLLLMVAAIKDHPTARPLEILVLGLCSVILLVVGHILICLFQHQRTWKK
jgi:hypothetical protein